MDLTLREIIDRYGPTIALILAIFLLVALFPATESSEEGQLTSAEGPAAIGDQGLRLPNDETSDPTDVLGESIAGPTGGGDGPVAAAGTGDADTGSGEIATTGSGAQQFGEENCGADGRMAGISRIMPPCVGQFIGQNPGATARGVTGEAINIVRYRPQTAPATQAALIAAGADDSDEDQDRMDAALVDYFAHHYETYGREPNVITMEASGESSNDQAMRSDALTIVNEHKAFIVWGAPDTLVEELVARGVICICTTSLSDRFYQKTNGLVFSSLPSAEEYYTATAEYIGKRLKGRTADHAGLGSVGLPRKFGLLYWEQSSSGPRRFAKEGRDFFLSEMKDKYGIGDVKAVGYSSDLSQAQEQTTNVVAQFQDAGVTTIALASDPLFPIFLTKEATRQNYFPEWLIMGTALTDTTFFGRTYDQTQWGNAFGISPLWVFWVDVSTSSGFREYHHARPGSNRGDEGVSINVRRAPIQWILQGIHMAGPTLTPQTFAEGMYNFPASGGTPDTPLVDFTPEHPNAIKDFTEVWWKVDGSGRDETGKDGPGTLMKVDGGKRWLTGTWPTTEPKVFVDEGAVYTQDFEDAPEHEQDGHTHPYDEQKCKSCPAG